MAVEDEYPALFAERVGKRMTARFGLEFCDPSPDLVASVYIVGFVGHEVVLPQPREHEAGLLGGTLEPGESALEALRRELREEAGASLVSFVPFGGWRCRWLTEPFRPHLPRPIFYRLVGYGDLRLDGRPTDENARIQVVPLEEAVKRFAASGHRGHADLHRLAFYLRRDAG